jgi:hypothetical protein
LPCAVDFIEEASVAVALFVAEVSSSRLGHRRALEGLEEMCLGTKRWGFIGEENITVVELLENANIRLKL